MIHADHIYVKCEFSLKKYLIKWSRLNVFTKKYESNQKTCQDGAMAPDEIRDKVGERFHEKL